MRFLTACSRCFVSVASGYRCRVSRIHCVIVGAIPIGIAFGRFQPRFSHSQAGVLRYVVFALCTMSPAAERSRVKLQWLQFQKPSRPSLGQTTRLKIYLKPAAAVTRGDERCLPSNSIKVKDCLQLSPRRTGEKRRERDKWCSCSGGREERRAVWRLDTRNKQLDDGARRG